MALLGEKSIDAALAIEKYKEADKKAKAKASSKRKNAYGADEIACELENLLGPIIMEKNLQDEKEYSRIKDLITQWNPDVHNEEMQQCALIQQILLNCLPIFKQQQQHKQIKETIKALDIHLKNKIKNEGAYTLDKKEDDPTLKSTSSGISQKNQKTAARYNAIHDLHITIKDLDHLGHEHIDMAKAALKTCLQNKPDWSERPFLQKLTDVLSLGFKPLFRAFFSKETDLEEKLDQSIKPLRCRQLTYKRFGVSGMVLM